MKGRGLCVVKEEEKCVHDSSAFGEPPPLEVESRELKS